MSFFDKLTSTAKTIGEKAKDTAEITKLKLKISSAEGDIKALQTAVGRKLAEGFPGLMEEHFPQELAKMKELKETIAALNAKIIEVKTDAPAETECGCGGPYKEVGRASCACEEPKAESCGCEEPKAESCGCAEPKEESCGCGCSNQQFS